MPFDTVLPEPGEMDVRLRLVTLSASGTAGSRRTAQTDGDLFWAKVEEASDRRVSTLVRAGRAEAIGAFQITTYHDAAFTEHTRLKDEDKVFSTDPNFRFSVIVAAGTPGQKRTLICRTLTG